MTKQLQYEELPYPHRDPADETKRLIEGSPSHPAEIDHYLFSGKRDWSKPFRVLVAGGGTGDSLIMLAAKLEAIQVPAEIVYLDLSKSSREIAQQRAQIRKLKSIKFITGDLLDAPKLGTFDYIDCCGVLHHLENPQQGFEALSQALSDDGGLGGMVYAPYGRNGVYPLQAAFAALMPEDSQQQKLSMAKKIVAALPHSNLFARNPYLGDHKIGDAGFYDLLLHASDMPMTVEMLNELLNKAQLTLTTLIEPIIYDPRHYLPIDADIEARLNRMNWVEQAALAEKLSGSIKTHVFYASKKSRNLTIADPTNLSLIPTLYGVNAEPLARHIAKHGKVTATINTVAYEVSLPPNAAPLISLIGNKSLAEIAKARQLSPASFNKQWRAVHDALTSLNVLRYSDRF